VILVKALILFFCFNKIEDVNVVKLDTDVMKFFPDAKSVNEVLRILHQKEFRDIF